MTAQVLDLISVFALGLSVGLTACAASCLPFIGTWAFARAGGGVQAAGDLVAFLAGRLCGYALLGAGAGWAGEGLLKLLAGPPGHWAVGGAGLVAGLALLGGGKAHAACRVAQAGWSPAAMGVALSLTPCVPLATLLAAATMAGKPVAGAAMGVAFGLGAAVTPMIVVVPLIGAMGRSIALRPGLKRWLRIGSAMVLLALSIRHITLGL
jgi:sulfite exporter TauE/SafE